MNGVTDTLHRRVGERVYLIVCAALLAIPPVHTDGATLLDFPSLADYSLGHLFAWQAGSSFLMTNPSQGPFTFTYSIDAGFLANQGGLSPDKTNAIVSRIFATWTQASQGYFSFVPAPWSAVQNEGGGPPALWEGQPIADWLSGNLPGVLPGWGANIDIFSVPSGFTITSQSTTFTMGPNNLAFAIINRVGSIAIRSVDIYLNEDFKWVDTELQPSSGSDPVNGSGGDVFDVGTVLMHEVGHALGLDHPNQAVAAGSLNFSPYTFIPGQSWSTGDLMFSLYRGPRGHPTIDEVGGIACLYGLPSTLDFDADGIVTSADLAALLLNWGAQTLGGPGDVNYDGNVNAVDLGLLFSNFGAQPTPPTSAPISAPLHDGPTGTGSRPDSPIIFECYHVAPDGAPNPQ